MLPLELVGPALALVTVPDCPDPCPDPCPVVTGVSDPVAVAPAEGQVDSGANPILELVLSNATCQFCMKTSPNIEPNPLIPLATPKQR